MKKVTTAAKNVFVLVATTVALMELVDMAKVIAIKTTTAVMACLAVLTIAGKINNFSHSTIII